MNGYLLEFSLNSIAFVLKQFLLSRLLFRVSIASSSVVGFIFRFVLFFVFNLMACLVCVDPFSLHHLRGEMTAAELPQHKHIQLQAKVHDVQGVAREIDREKTARKAISASCSAYQVDFTVRDATRIFLHSEIFSVFSRVPNAIIVIIFDDCQQFFIHSSHQLRIHTHTFYMRMVRSVAHSGLSSSYFNTSCTYTHIRNIT